ncbi:MAG: hypothetical protein ACOYT4_05380 [Nanoarchaeota archaeon]
MQPKKIPPFNLVFWIEDVPRNFQSDGQLINAVDAYGIKNNRLTHIVFSADGSYSSLYEEQTDMLSLKEANLSSKEQEEIMVQLREHLVYEVVVNGLSFEHKKTILSYFSKDSKLI